LASWLALLTLYMASSRREPKSKSITEPSRLLTGILTEPAVEGNPALAVHVLRGALHEGKDLVPAALGSTTEVLASKLGEPDGPAEDLVVTVDVTNESLSVGAVEVGGNAVDGAAAASREELLEPTLTRGTIGRGR